MIDTTVLRIDEEPALRSAIERLKKRLLLHIAIGLALGSPALVVAIALWRAEARGGSGGIGPVLLGVASCCLLWIWSRAWLLALLVLGERRGTAETCSVQVGPETTKHGDPLLLLLPQQKKFQGGSTSLRWDPARFAASNSCYLLGHKGRWVLIAGREPPIAAALRPVTPK